MDYNNANQAQSYENPLADSAYAKELSAKSLMKASVEPLVDVTVVADNKTKALMREVNPEYDLYGLINNLVNQTIRSGARTVNVNIVRSN